jgi:hypothetical protein
MVRIAIELLAEGRIDEKQALMQEPSKLEDFYTLFLIFSNPKC